MLVVEAAIQSDTKMCFGTMEWKKCFIKVKVACKSDRDGIIVWIAGGLRDLLGVLLSQYFSCPSLFHVWVLSGHSQ